MPSIDPLIFPFEMNAKPTYSKGKKRGKNLTSQCTQKDINNMILENMHM